MPSDSTSLAEEGVLIEAFPLVRAGVFDDARIRGVLEGGAHPARRPDDNIADLEAMVAPYHMEEMWLGYIGEEVWETNWKSMIENYMEGYHLSPLHKTGLANLNPTDMCAHIPASEHWFGYTVGFPDDLPRVTPGHPSLTKEQSNTCIMAMVQPGSGTRFTHFL